MSTAVLVVLLILAVLLLAGNTMIAIAFLKGRKGGYKGFGRRDDTDLNELHRRVQDLKNKDQ